MGGFTADHFGYRPSFVVSGGLFILAGILTILFVREKFVPPPPDQTKPGLGGMLRDIRTRGRDRIRRSHSRRVSSGSGAAPQPTKRSAVRSACSSGWASSIWTMLGT